MKYKNKQQMDKVHSEYDNHALISSKQFEKTRQEWQQHLMKYMVSKLAKHLQWIFKKESQLSIPTGPDLIVWKQKSIRVLGTQTVDVTTLDCKYLANKN